MPAPRLKNRLAIAALAAVTVLSAAPAGGEEAIGAGAANENCVECGLRKPGTRPRELAILESADKIVEAARRSPSAAELDFSAVNSLPVRTRPTSAQADRMSERDPLLHAMNADMVTFRRMRYLLPNKFRIADGSKFQPMIDDAVLKLASTEAGRRAVCPFTAGGEKTVEMYFQVTAHAAREIAQGCRGFPIPPAVAQRLRVMSEVRPPFQPTPMVPAKKFVFVFSESGRPEIEGYTAKNNTTYLVLTKETENSDSLQRMIAHELAISYDQLSRLGYLSNVTTIEDQGVGLAFGKNVFDETFVEPKSRQELDEMRCAFRDPALRYAATAQRAFVFEDAVSEELGGSEPVAAKGTCSEILAKNSVLLQAMARSVAWDTGWYQAACGVAKDPAQRLQQILGRIRKIEETRLTCKDPRDCGGQKQMSLCDLLLHPRIGPNNQDLDSGGPRPRMGGGWDGAALEREDLIVRASAGGTLTKDQVKELGDALLFPNMDQLDREESVEIPAPRSAKRPRGEGVSL